MVGPCGEPVLGNSSILRKEIVTDPFEEFVLGNEFMSREEVRAHPCERS